MIPTLPARSAAYPGDLLDHLRAFITLAACVERGERGAFARTATELAVDVSVLRRRMQTLATFIGAPLVEGRGPRLHLTPAGARARAHALKALEAAAELALVGDDAVGPLRIACTGTVLAEILPRALRALRMAHPKLLFRVRRAGAEASRTLVTDGEIDFAIIRGASKPAGVASIVSVRIACGWPFPAQTRWRDAERSRCRRSHGSPSSATRRRPRR